MKFVRSISACVALLVLPLVSHAEQKTELPASPWTVTVGTKAWLSTWTSWEITRVQAGGSSLQALTPLSSDSEVAFTPFVNLRHERLFATASFMTDTDYTLESSLSSRSGTRSERDLNVGYDILPGLSLTAGYKQLTQDVGGEYKWRGPTLAASVSAPLQSGLSAYGTYGIGWLKATLPTEDASGSTSLDADYTVSEFGLAYSFDRERTGFATLTLTMGYRAQTVITRDYALSSQPGGAVYANDDARDFTQGLTFSVIGTF
ncbi:MAG: hypothetical protein HY308_04185 [Gammaproteobacteria bacterium]|nr:hypothetical protein [Gammaproteobacteria bacterium]